MKLYRLRTTILEKPISSYRVYHGTPSEQIFNQIIKHGLTKKSYITSDICTASAYGIRLSSDVKRPSPPSPSAPALKKHSYVLSFDMQEDDQIYMDEDWYMDLMWSGYDEQDFLDAFSGFGKKTAQQLVTLFRDIRKTDWMNHPRLNRWVKNISKRFLFPIGKAAKLSDLRAYTSKRLKPIGAYVLIEDRYPNYKCIRVVLDGGDLKIGNEIEVTPYC